MLSAMSDHRSSILRSIFLTGRISLLFVAAVSSASARVGGVPVRSAGKAVDNVVLITLDGVRTEEIFGGLDLDVLRSTLRSDAKVEETRAYQSYWAPTPEARRVRLMPFFWGTLMAQHGSIAGNRARRSSVRVTNRLWFSYPGYAEILTGEAHDNEIKSNDKIRNPYPTVLEFLKRKLSLDARQVAAFASWDTFDSIVEHQAGAITSNAGFETYAHGDREIEVLNRLQSETLTPWDAARYDAYTWRFAMAHLQKFRPRVLYIALDETDDWAHDGRYDRVLDTLNRTDKYVAALWNFLQSERNYRHRTALIITVDHGRGDTPADWRNHGEKVPGSEHIWMAFVGPEWTLRGEWQDSEPIYQKQVAATLARALGLDYTEQSPTAGGPIMQLFAR